MKAIVDIDIKEARDDLYITDQDEKWLSATDEEIKDEVIKRIYAVKEIRRRNEKSHN